MNTLHWPPQTISADARTREGALRTQTRLLRFGHKIVGARDKSSLLAVTEDICTVIEAEHLAVYVRGSNQTGYKLRFSSRQRNACAATFAFAKKIEPERKLWQFLDQLPDKQLLKIPGKFRLGTNTYGVARRNNHGDNTVLLLSFATGITPGFNLIFLKWLYSALDKALIRVRNKQVLAVENTGLNYLTKQTEETFARWQADQGWQYFNQPYIYRLGYREQDYPLDNVFGCKTLVRPSDWPRLLTQLQDCRETGSEQKCYYSIKAPDGTWRSMLTTLIRVSDNGKTCVNAVSVDISAAKHAEQQVNRQRELEKWLIAQNKRLHVKGDSTTVGDVLEELNTRFQFSRSALFTWHHDTPRLYACHVNSNSDQRNDPEELIKAVDALPKHLLQSSIAVNDICQDLDTPVNAAFAKALLGTAISITPVGGEQPVGFLLCECSEPHHWNELEQRATSALGDTLAMVLTKENILEKLEASRRQFQMALDATNYGMWELNIPEQLIKVSPNYYKMLGFDQPGPTDYRPIRVKNIHIDDKETVLQQGQQLREGTIQEVDYETRHHTRSGGIKWIQTRGKVIKWDDRGKPLRAMGTTSDITELKKVQTDLRLAYQQAEAARLAKGEFLARMSHEIRTPMNAIIGLTYMLLQSKLSPKQSTYLLDIDRAAKSLLQIIDDILDFSKIEAGKLTIERHNVNFRKQIERICQRYDDLVVEKNLRFDVNIHDNVPHILRLDSTRIRQVLVNLLNNAFKFTKQGAVTLTIDCDKLSTNERLLKFCVQDTGIGLDTEQIATLFDPFTQADGSRTRQYGGTGLGLSISKMLVEMMGGDIEVGSEKHRGSVFTFSVKCQSVSRKAKTLILADDNSPTGGPGTDFKHLKVLLVEDNKVNQKVAVGMLRKLGITPTVANNGTEAVYIMKATEGGEFDLILMDIEMPYMGGFEATNAIRRIGRHRNVPIIAMTAHVVENEKERYLRAGMNDCISKPIAPAALARTMEANLSGRTGQ